MNWTQVCFQQVQGLQNYGRKNESGIAILEFIQVFSSCEKKISYILSISTMMKNFKFLALKTKFHMVHVFINFHDKIQISS